jgi:TonB family protein
MSIDTTHIRTFPLTLAVLLVISASSLFAQETSNDAVVTTEQIPDPDENWYIPMDKEPGFNTDELYSHLKYPRAARKKNIKGRVVIQVYINKEGKVLQTRIVQSDNPLLEEAAVNAIRQTTFIPAIQGGKAISVWWTIPVSSPRN